MGKELPDPESIPGMIEALKQAGSDITVLGNEPNMTWEMKLKKLDENISDAVKEDNGAALGRLVEWREAVIQERFILTGDYIEKRNDIIKEIEPQEGAELRAGNEVGARRLQFEKYRRLFLIQEQFIARNYPIRFFIKERLRGWGSSSTPSPSNIR